MSKLRSCAGVVLSVAMMAIPSLADDVEREILVPAGWGRAYRVGYAPVVKVGGMVIVSGVAASGEGTYEEKVRRMYERTADLLEAAGASFEDVVEITTFHLEPKDSPSFLAEWERYLRIHRSFYGEHRPAWSAVGTSALLSGTAPVEMRTVAVVGSAKNSRVVFEDPSEAPTRPPSSSSKPAAEDGG